MFSTTRSQIGISTIKCGCKIRLNWTADWKSCTGLHWSAPVVLVHSRRCSSTEIPVNSRSPTFREWTSSFAVYPTSVDRLIHSPSVYAVLVHSRSQSKIRCLGVVQLHYTPCHRLKPSHLPHFPPPHFPPSHCPLPLLFLPSDLFLHLNLPIISIQFCQIAALTGSILSRCGISTLESISLIICSTAFFIVTWLGWSCSYVLFEIESTR
jgi:hypothetical protein